MRSKNVIDFNAARAAKERPACICCKHWTHRDKTRDLGLDADESICRRTGEVVDVGNSCSRFRRAPGAGVWPMSADEIAALVRRLDDEFHQKSPRLLAELERRGIKLTTEKPESSRKDEDESVL